MCSRVTQTSTSCHGGRSRVDFTQNQVRKHTCLNDFCIRSDSSGVVTETGSGSRSSVPRPPPSPRHFIQLLLGYPWATKRSRLSSMCWVPPPRRTCPEDLGGGFLLQVSCPERWFDLIGLLNCLKKENYFFVIVTKLSQVWT